MAEALAKTCDLPPIGTTVVAAAAQVLGSSEEKQVGPQG